MPPALSQKKTVSLHQFQVKHKLKIKRIYQMGTIFHRATEQEYNVWKLSSKVYQTCEKYCYGTYIEFFPTGRKINVYSFKTRNKMQ
jgi:hypothetical protein